MSQTPEDFASTSTPGGCTGSGPSGSDSDSLVRRTGSDHADDRPFPPNRGAENPDFQHGRPPLAGKAGWSGIDLFEILTRFAAIVELGELRRRLGEHPFPEPLARALHDQIERPTLGQWKNLLRVTAECLARTDPLVVPELREFALGELIPGLERGPR